MLSLQGGRVPHASLSMQRQWYLVSVGSAWATARPLLITGQLDETGVITEEVPKGHVEGN